MNRKVLDHKKLWTHIKMLLKINLLNSTKQKSGNLKLKISILNKLRKNNQSLKMQLQVQLTSSKK